MKKNGEYVGVDEKYIPDEEKYVDNNLNSEIKNDIKNIYYGAKEYVSDKDNQEKMKNIGRKGIKVAKGIGISYLIYIGIIIVLVIALFIFIFSQMFRMSRQTAGIKNEATNIISNGIHSMEVSEFNTEIEWWSGTQDGDNVTSLLDKVVSNIKKNSNHKITVIYGTTKTSKPDEITALKKQFDKTIQYEVSLDYDSKGYINKVTITNY